MTLQTPRILIAEDDWTSRTMLTAMLRKWNYEPVVTENGAQALAVLQQEDAPRVALLDWGMPEMDGLAVIEQVRALKPVDPPYLIMLTSHQDKARMIAGLDAGANDYIIKPFDPRELHARLRVGLRVVELQASLIQARNALTELVMYDGLTGIANRRASEQALIREVARAQREGGSLTIGMCDLDHFKEVNDTYGHLVGDDMLCGFTCRLISYLRAYDHLGRWGGEEFLLIIPGYLLSDSADVYQRLQTIIGATPIQTRAGDISITVSIGVASWSSGQSWEEMLAAADAALYEAKRSGRNRVCLAPGHPLAVR